MTLVQDWLPASRRNYEWLLHLWVWYPIFPTLQWAVAWYGMGKTSVESRLNIPGRIAWITMEAPGFLTLLYIMNTLPAQQGITDLPWQNKVLAGLFVLHYIYRALLFPVMQPSMSPIHLFVWSGAVMFQFLNATCLGCWLAAYGPTRKAEWQAQSSLPQFAFGLMVFYVGLTFNYFCDEELREIRRAEQRRQDKVKGEGKKGIEKHYTVPQNGLFRYMLFPHYLLEWIEWTGFWIAAGLSCTPARCFLVNEFTAMLPRAVNGGKWYRDKFGVDEVKGKWVIIPGVW